MDCFTNTKIKTYGRTAGRSANKKMECLSKISNQNRIDIKQIDMNVLLSGYKKYFFEIGFGYGEHTEQQALLNKDACIIACEVYIDGVISLLNKMENKNIDNIKIFNGDARLLLEKFPNNSLDKIFILFPDPWPKKKHNKRRIINNEFIDLIKSKLKIGGTLLFASDILDYINWTIDCIGDKLQKNFNDITNCKQEPKWWVQTKYQKKAIKEGRESYFLEFSKLP